MPEYRRSFIEGGTYFFTVVTYQRRPILTTSDARELLHAAWASVNERSPFTTPAICLLPDHIHCIWTLPEGDINYSLRWREIKKFFSKAYPHQNEAEGCSHESRQNRGEASLWQRRFWEHTIRDPTDYQRHLDYIHYNPVKHGWVQKAADWQWSSFQRYVRMGYYDPAWGSSLPEEFTKLSWGE